MDGARARAAIRLGARVAPWIAIGVLVALWPRRAKGAAGLSIQAAGPPQSFAIAEPHRGRMADAPQAIPPRGWKDILWRTWREMGVDRLTAVAGGVTFYSLLAIFPAIGVLVSLYGLFGDVSQVRLQLAQLGGVIPVQALDVVGDQMVRLAERPHGALSLAFVISLLFSVWSANAGMKALFDGLNVAYDETERRGYLRRSALSYVFTLAALVFLTLASGVLVMLPGVIAAAGLDPDAAIWMAPRWLGLWGLAAAGFAGVYRYGPSRQHPRWRWVWLGAVVAATLWLAGSLVFSWYVAEVAHFDTTYGPLGTVMAFMVWIWFSIFIVLAGAELNAEAEHQTAVDSTTGAPLPMGARGAAMADTVGLAFRFDLGRLLRRTGTDAALQAAKVRAAAGRLSRTRPPGPPGGRPDPRRSGD